MAKKVTTICDVCSHQEEGKHVEATEGREIGLDGKLYLLDLCEPHGGQLDQALNPFIDVASSRTTYSSGAPSRRTPARAPVRSKEERDGIREWARTHGFPAAERGRLPKLAVEAYRLAHQPNGSGPSRSRPNRKAR